MKITFLYSATLSPDGVNIKEYEAGKTYTANTPQESITFTMAVVAGIAVEYGAHNETAPTKISTPTTKKISNPKSKK
jgi:hypothetical protein